MDSQITLIAKTYTSDSIGQMAVTETQSTIFCRIESISSDEYFNAGRAGLNPQYRVKVHDFEYAGQNECILNGVRYDIYRTYRSKGLEELYLTTRTSNKVAANG